MVTLKQSLLILLMILCIFLSVSCGKRGPSLPPIVVAPEACSDFVVRQVGRSILLTFPLPKRNTDGSLISEKLGVEILTYISGESNGDVNVHTFLQGAQRTAITPDELEKCIVDDRVGIEKNLFELSGEKIEGKRFSWAVRFFNTKKKKSPLSKIISISVVKPQRPPEALSAQTEEAGIRLSWQYPELVDQSACARLFNVYRIEALPEDSSQEGVFNAKSREKMHVLLNPVNDAPISSTSFFDEECSFGRDYIYSVRAVCDSSLPAKESENSGFIYVKHRDVFPPKRPSGLAAVTERGVIRLFWFPNNDKDLAGYRVYRGINEENYQLIASLPDHVTSFSDEDIMSHVQYSYYITAYDSAQPSNESTPSEIASETAPEILNTDQGAEK